MNDTHRKMFIVPHAGYPFNVLVAVGVPDAQLEKKLAAHGVTVDDDCRAAIAMHGLGRTAQFTAGGQTVLRLASWNGTPDDHGHLAHEVFHAVEFLMRRIGIELCPQSHEAFAYAIGNLTRRIIERLPTPISTASATAERGSI